MNMNAKQRLPVRADFFPFLSGRKQGHLSFGLCDLHLESAFEFVQVALLLTSNLQVIGMHETHQNS